VANFFFFYAIIEIGHEKQIIKTLNLNMTIVESQIFIALFIALGNGFLAFLLGSALYPR
jgi:photosystem I reaction center subunit XII